MNVALSALMTGQSGVKPGKGDAAVPEGFAALMGEVPTGEAGVVVAPFTVAAEGEAVLLTGESATAEGTADAIDVGMTAMEGGDPTALSMEPSFAGLMNAPQTTVPVMSLASGMATGGPVVAALQVSMQANGTGDNGHVISLAPTVVAPAADPLGVGLTPAGATASAQTASAPSVVSTAAAVVPIADGDVAAPAIQTPVVVQAATSATAATQQPVVAVAEVQTVTQTQAAPGIQAAPKPQFSNKVTAAQRTPSQTAAPVIEGAVAQDSPVDTDTPVAPLRQATFGAEQPTFLNNAAAQGKPALDLTATLRPADVLSAQPVESNPLVLADQASDLKAAAPSPEMQSKPAPKPFADALISQVKSVEAKEGRTSVSLHPRGLGQIEIDVVTDKEHGTRVVVRVENPAVLQTLRDERQLLAQGLGFTDAGSFEFQQGFSEDRTRDQQQPHVPLGGGNDDGAGTVTAGVQHKNVVDDGQLDILT